MDFWVLNSFDRPFGEQISLSKNVALIIFPVGVVGLSIIVGDSNFNSVKTFL